MIAIDLRIVLIPAACASILLAAGGVIVFRRIRAAVSIPWPATKDAEQQGDILIDGVRFPLQRYEQELIVAVGLKRPLELCACVILATSALCIMLALPVERFQTLQIGAYEAEFICIVGLVVLLTTLRWFTERRFLARSRCTVGTLIGVDPGFHLRSVTYQFFDPNRERRGGRGPFWDREIGNAVLVFFDPRDPDNNAAHSGFFFHRFRMELIPARNRGRTPVASSN